MNLLCCVQMGEFTKGLVSKRTVELSQAGVRGCIRIRLPGPALLLGVIIFFRFGCAWSWSLSSASTPVFFLSLQGD